jgi:hypothetical protein
MLVLDEEDRGGREEKEECFVEIEEIGIAIAINPLGFE